MGKETTLQLLELQDYPQYLEICCDTLNTEWRRSDASRMHGLKKSNKKLPVNLVLVDKVEDGEPGRFLGHARVCRIVEDEKACFIESVIVIPELRGYGIGRSLMELVEEYCLGRGFHRVYLTSKDKQAFYARLGYTYCEAMTATSSSCSIRLPGFKNTTYTPKLKPVVGNSPTIENQPANGAPHPPEPPQPRGVSLRPREDKDWMMKSLICD